MENKVKKHQCIFCEGEASIDYYMKEKSEEEIEATLALWKICTKHARMLDDANMNREKIQIERAVA